HGRAIRLLPDAAGTGAELSRAPDGALPVAPPADDRRPGSTAVRKKPMLGSEHLEALRRLNTPTIANAIETFNVRPRNLGFTSPEIRCMFPEFEPIVGFAATATIMAEQPGEGTRKASRPEYWDYLAGVPAPRIAVIQDLDQPPAVGSFWGEVNANIHRALGCAGTITNGGVRDLDEVREIGFQM